jgi:hypothetical protein
MGLKSDQADGLLGLGAALLQASGPSLRPTSFGQALGQGLAGFQQAQQASQDREQQRKASALNQQLLGLKIKDAESDVANQQMVRERNARIAKRLPGGAAQLPQMDDQQAPMASTMPGGAMSPKVGGPDWMQAYQQQSGLQGGSPATTGVGSAGAARGNATQDFFNRAATEAQIRSEEGDIDGANKAWERAAKFLPEVHKIEVALDGNNKPVNVITYKDGRQEVSQYGAKPDLTEVRLGNRVKFVDKSSTPVGTEYTIGQSPDSIAADRRDAANRAAGGTEPSLNDQTLNFLADQALRGDPTVYQNLGRGAQGAANLVALRTRVAQQAQSQGLSGADLASIGADYQGQKAGLRTSGTISARIENAAAEAAQLAPLAVDAGRQVARSGFLPFGKAQVMFDSNTNSPELNRFATANIGLATAYAGAMARGGKATVSDNEHARELLSTAKSQEAYEAIVSQMQQEIAAAQRAPQHVRDNLRGQISGRGGDHGATTVPNPVAAPAPAASIPNAAIQRLRMQPSLQAAFDEKYGAGAAASILGK